MRMSLSRSAWASAAHTKGAGGGARAFAAGARGLLGAPRAAVDPDPLPELALAGDLDHATARPFEEAAVACLEARRPFVLDLTALESVSPAGLGSLAAVVARAAARGVGVRLRPPLRAQPGLLAALLARGASEAAGPGAGAAGAGS